ncbi:helicase C-terminal domain-containing protein [Blastocladiella britannica]|nr:helicase C-terminal domain-containing protein [Blastocladiella britannica]
MSSIMRDYDFPFPPYPIQVGLMDAVYEAMDRRGIALIESPTGTGKSLSLICGTLKWLADNHDNPSVLTNVDELEPSVSTGTDTAPNKVPAWVREQAEELERARKLDVVRAFRTSVATRVNAARHSRTWHDLATAADQGARTAPKRRRRNAPTNAAASSSSKSSAAAAASDLDDADLVIDYKADNADSKLEDDDDDTALAPPNLQPPQLIYASRTHSQLTQFMGELRKTRHVAPKPSWTTSTSSNGHEKEEDEGDERPIFSAVALASRKNLCINERVLAESRGSASRLNDACLDLQKNRSKSKKATAADSEQQCGCPYMEAGALDAFRDHALTHPHDIEDLGELGRTLSACPYYGARRAAPLASVLAIPYHALIHAPTRTALGIRVRGNVLVVDEAHNVADAISSAHSVELDAATVERAFNQVSQYEAKYAPRMRPDNRVLVRQTMAVVMAIHGWLKKTCGTGSVTSRMLTVPEFVAALEVEHLNLFSILAFLQKSELSRKVLGFLEKHHAGTVSDFSANADAVYVVASPLRVVESLLDKLVAPDADGRVLFVAPSPESRLPVLKYLALNPASHLSELIRQAHAVIFAGGTMSPMSDFEDFLFPDRYGKPLISYSCGHVVPSESVKCMGVPLAPSGRPIRCTMEGRKESTLLDDISAAIANITNVVPNGMVVFLPSFQMLNELETVLRTRSYLERIEKRKRVFLEPREAAELEPLLREYARHLDIPGNGALLLAVVGGKMSEGINFSDHLARCVVMVGMPYANRGSVELLEKLRYLDTIKAGASREHYENLCMRAVNQAIGRAIRHRGDYSAMLLLDVRYEERADVRDKLPEWLSQSMAPQREPQRPFGQVVRSLAGFFKSRSFA